MAETPGVEGRQARMAVDSKRILASLAACKTPAGMFDIIRTTSSNLTVRREMVLPFGK